jgi:uncharacterized OB-fold protein
MSIPRHWRLKAQRYHLEGSICLICGQPTFPPRPVCPHHIAQVVRITGYGLSALPLSNRISGTNSLKEG